MCPQRTRIRWRQLPQISEKSLLPRVACSFSSSSRIFHQSVLFRGRCGELGYRQLRKQSVKTDEKPGQEDFGWYLNFEVAGSGYCFVIGHRPTGKSEAGTWIGWLERSRGFIGSVSGGRKREIQPLAAEVIHKVLSSSPLIRDVRWHFQREFNSGHDERGASSPQTPL